MSFYADLSGGGQGVCLLRDGRLQTIVDTRGSFVCIGPLGPTMTEAGAVAFRADRTAGVSGVFAWDDAGVTTVAETDGPWSRFHGLPVITRDGTVVFRGDRKQSQGYILGDIHGQPLIPGSLPNGAWSKTGPYDVQVVLVSSYPAAAGYGFGSQALRISDAVTSGSFGDQTFSPGLADEAGESGADNAGLSGGVRRPHFDASFLIGTTQSTQQCVGCPTPLKMTVSPDRGDGARMSFLRFEDQMDGVHVFFVDVTDPGRVVDGDTFNTTDIATLDRAHSHLITFSIDFKDGPANDQVKIYIDGSLKETGTTWEDYYRYDGEQGPQGNKVPTVDKLLFRESGTGSPLYDPNPSDAGQGFLLDRVSLASSANDHK